MSVPRCTHCNGSVLAGSCLACGRETTPNLVTLGEARAGLLRGVRTALLIELVLAVGVLAGMLLVAVWPAP